MLTVSAWAQTSSSQSSQNRDVPRTQIPDPQRQRDPQLESSPQQPIKLPDQESAAASGILIEKSLTIVIALAACVQAGAAVWQGFIYRRQTRLASQTLVATFRPRLLVRNVVLDVGTVVTVAGTPDKAWAVRYTITNTGGSPAKVTHLLADSVYPEEGGLPAIARFRDGNAFTESFSLQPGQHREVTSEIPKNVSDYVRFLRSVGQGATDLYFTGYLRFADELGLSRSYGFCRKYNPNLKRFEIVDNPDYEFAD